ncbi:MAG: 50S ribosomal protein L4 [Thermoplasmata archaeon]|nr:50S ribosomal protein L4 [Thermoplasmata archaeon]
MKAKVYGMDGNVVQEIDLPSVFEAEYRPDVIHKAFVVMRANRRQPYGSKPTAGKDYVAESFGPGRGSSRIPRLASGRGARAPGTVHGRRAHPPKVEKVWSRRINKKEKLLARISAIAATANEELVRSRGHKFEGNPPFIIEDNFEELEKTKDILSTFEKIGVIDDVIRAKEGKHIRAGRGKRRGRKYKTPKSLLIVASRKDKIKKAASNLTGVDVVTPDEINVEHLAPGGHAGRLTLYTLSAVKRIGERYESI